MAPATSRACAKSTSPAIRLLSVRRRDAVDADVDDGRARLDPVALDELGGIAERGEQQILVAANLRQVARLRMCDRHRRALADQQLGEWPADHIGAPHYYCIEAGERGPYGLGQDHAGARCVHGTNAG